jgi:hypothetical protein
MELFTAKVQRDLSYIVVGGVFLLIVLNGSGYVSVTDTVFSKIFDAAFLIVLLFWFNRQRQGPDSTIPPGAAGKSTTTTETIVTSPKGGAPMPAKTEVITKETTDVPQDKP